MLILNEARKTVEVKATVSLIEYLGCLKLRFCKDQIVCVNHNEARLTSCEIRFYKIQSRGLEETCRQNFKSWTLLTLIGDSILTFFCR